MIEHLTASKNPIVDIQRITYAGQDEKLRVYKEGYENRLEEMPVLDKDDPFLSEKVQLTKTLMQRLATDLKTADWVKGENVPDDNGFVRTILCIEPPAVDGNGRLKEGTEIVLGKWGKGRKTPIHGHAAGYIHEEMIFGKLLVTTYRRKNNHSNKVRPIQTVIAQDGINASMYTMPSKLGRTEALIHSFTALELSASLHYFPEHTRDGRGNTFIPEYFDDVYNPTTADVTRITTLESMYARKGDVILVRSENVPDLKDHYAVVTGHPVMKEHGLRPQTISIEAPTNTLLDKFEMRMGITALRLNEKAKAAFHLFHGITIKNGEVILPNS